VTDLPGLRSLLGFQFAKCGSWLEQRLEQRLAPLGIRVRHFLVLTLLDSATGRSQQEMATYLSLDPTVMVALVDELERQKLVERTRDEADRRRYAVRSTAKGRQLQRKARAIADAVGDEVFGPLDKAERRRLAELVQRVMAPYWAEVADRAGGSR
jgi:DNA-binding MarR family transcriptional regulator